MTSAISARMSKRVTAESKARAALTIVPRFTEEHGSSANSEEAILIVSPKKEKKNDIKALIYIYFFSESINHSLNKTFLGKQVLLLKSELRRGNTV